MHTFPVATYPLKKKFSILFQLPQRATNIRIAELKNYCNTDVGVLSLFNNTF